MSYFICLLFFCSGFGIGLAFITLAFFAGYDEKTVLREAEQMAPGSPNTKLVPPGGTEGGGGSRGGVGGEGYAGGGNTGGGHSGRGSTSGGGSFGLRPEGEGGRRGGARGVARGGLPTSPLSPERSAGLQCVAV